MALSALGTAEWIVNKALSKLSNDVLEAWAASNDLGSNIQNIKTELLFAHAVLQEGEGLEINNNKALVGLLRKLTQMAYDAEDLLDELEYFRIQDELDCSYEVAEQVDGVVHDLTLHTRHAFKAVGKYIRPLLPPSSSKLKFDRADMSNRMKCMAGQLQPICDRISNVLNLKMLSSINNKPAQATSTNKYETTSKTTEPQLFGRDNEKAKIITELTSGKHDKDIFTVVPIVGHGGVGKTTLIQHVCEDEKVKTHFHFKIWVCVTVNFDVHRLTREILSCIPKDQDEKSEDKTENLDNLQSSIQKRLKSERFLLVLDDMWESKDDEMWKKLLTPFRNRQVYGNMIIVTTRDPIVANLVKTIDHLIEIKGLDDHELEPLFIKCVFGDEDHTKYPDLLNIGKEINTKLKGFPLAAKTVGRLLKSSRDSKHWRRILESDEWKSEEESGSIMSALRLSYKYLPFHLQQCFALTALFPDDYKFDSGELVHLWIALGIVHSNVENTRLEDIGLSHLKELVDHGLFERGSDDKYTMHDLIRDLAQMISSHECLIIDRSMSKSREIPLSIRHLSIITRYDDRFTDDPEFDENLMKELLKLKKSLKTKNLITLMLIGGYDSSFAALFRDVFKETKDLRILSISTMTHDPKFLLSNFSKFVHLRYLKLTSCYSNKMHLPESLSRFYHLRILDIERWHGDSNLPKNMMNLVNLRHFFVEDYLHSKIAWVGKLKHLQELREFKVGNDDGFQMSQLGELMELGGSLRICNLENVQSNIKAREAKLIYKKRLQNLSLSWNDEKLKVSPTTLDEEVLESLQPPSNIQKLSISGYRGTIFPSWFDESTILSKLESLSLENCGSIASIGTQGFLKLREIKFVNMPNLEKCAVGDSRILFSNLEVLHVGNCPKLKELLPFSECSISGPEESTNSFPSLRELYIKNCANMICVGKSGLKGFISLQSLIIRGCSKFLTTTAVDGISCFFPPSLQNLHLFDLDNEKLPSLSNLSSLTYLNIWNCEQLKLLALSNLSSLTSLRIESCQQLELLPLSNLPSLTSLVIRSCEQLKSIDLPIQADEAGGVVPAISCLTVEAIREGGSCVATSSPVVWRGEVNDEEIQEEEGCCLARPSPVVWEGEVNDEEIQEDGSCSAKASSLVQIKGVLLQSLIIAGCSNIEKLPSLSNLSSLTSLRICICPKLKSIDLPVQAGALEKLTIENCGSMEPLQSIPSHLKSLVVEKCPNLFDRWVSAAEAEAEELPSSLPPLENLNTDDPAFITTPFCNHLSSSLRELTFWELPDQVKCFTQEQETALGLLTSLHYLYFYECKKLRSLPAELSSLRSLKMLRIVKCPSIRSLPKKGLPSSLQEFKITGPNKRLKKQCRKLRGSNPNLKIIAN